MEITKEEVERLIQLQKELSWAKEKLKADNCPILPLIEAHERIGLFLRANVQKGNISTEQL